ncbi:hypothetical protein [Aminivibrio sp.]|jgi:hypothetical protein|uniref:hypothetical protein n=1 Tax=Aminivibrio sp. TaxID=1872489 RepID=UPI001A3DAAC8|nr:hypothetical protein [Aminivibrio sp.]MBL3538908.1 hypothetical protein [Aminivibrio sp.]
MGKFLFFLLACSMLFGAAISYEEYSQFLSLDSISVQTGAPEAESLFWKNLGPAELRYWPIFFFKSADLKKKMESEAPLVFSLRRENVSDFFVELEPLQPWLRLRWKEKDFFLSRDGRIWESDHPLNSKFPGIRSPSIPPFLLSEALPSPAVVPGEGIVVTSTVLPVSLFAEWVSGLETSGWMSHTREVEISRREGNYLLRLNLNNRDRTVRILIRGDQARWKEISSAVSQILHQLQFSGGDLIIDTTYTDRIIVRNVAGGGQEGSGR